PRKCIPRDIPTTSSSEYSEDFPMNWWSSEFPRNLISSEFRQKFPRDFRGKMNFRGVISEDFFVGMSSESRYSDDIPTIFSLSISLFSCSVTYRYTK
ncbi:unnamed protein product, partial [Brassica rapa]